MILRVLTSAASFQEPLLGNLVATAPKFLRVRLKSQANEPPSNQSHRVPKEQLEIFDKG